VKTKYINNFQRFIFVIQTSFFIKFVLLLYLLRCLIVFDCYFDSHGRVRLAFIGTRVILYFVKMVK